MKLLKPPEEQGGLSKMKAKLRPVKEEEEGEEQLESGEEDEEVKDVAEELCLEVQPMIEEMGDPALLALKRAGKLDVYDDDVVQRFKRHKATVGRVLFEAENANNLGVESFRLGDTVTAAAYFKRALELSSKERKPAAQELQVLKEFVKERFKGDVQAFCLALAEGEWRLALGRRRFVTAMRSMGYTGDADRLFEMMDHGEEMTDGKVTMKELTGILRMKASRLSDMDGEVLHKGIVLNNIGANDILSGSPAVGLQKLRLAYRICTRRARTSADGDALVQRVVINIAVAYMRMDDFDAALNYLPTAQERCEAMHGILHEDVLNALYLIGYCFLVKANRFHIVFDRKRMDGYAQENPVEVNYSLAQCAFKERLRRQYAALERVSGEVVGEEEQLQLEIARSHEIIAEIHDKRGEHDRALPHLQEAVAHKEAILSEGDPDVLSTWNTLAGVCVRLRRFDTALEVGERAVGAAASLFGEASLGVAAQVYHVGLTLFKLGVEQARTDKHMARASFDAAIERLTEVMDMQKELLEADDPQIASTAQMLGSVHMSAGVRTAARRCFENALLIRVAAYGRAHTATASSAHALGALYARMPRRHDEAVHLLRKAAVVREKRLGGESTAVADSLHELGCALLRRRRPKDSELALQHLSRAAQIRERRLGKDNVKYAASMHQVGQAHAHLGLFSEAKLYLQAAVALREQLLGKKNPQTAASRFALSVAVLELGETSLAMKHVKAAFAVRSDIFGLEHPQTADCLHQVGMVYVKKEERQAGLPYLHRALDVRIALNKDDAEQRPDDSDEDPAELKTQESARQKRIRGQREQRRKDVEKEERLRKLEESRAEAEQQREKRRMMANEDNVKALEALRQGGAKRSGSFGSILTRLRSRSASFRNSRTFHSDDDNSSGSEGGNSPQEAGGSPAGRQRRRAHIMAKDVSEQAAEAMADADRASDGSEELGVDEVGVDIRGCLAGTIGSSMQAISAVYMDLEDFTKSKWYLRRSMCLLEEVYGRISPECGECLHDFGVLYQRQDLYVKSVEYFRDALHTREQACGHFHEATANSCIALGDVLVLLGQAEDANIYILRGLRIRESLFGPEDRVVMELRDKWGLLMADQLQYDPVKQGEEMPHFAKRSPESYLHGHRDRRPLASR